MSTKRSSRNGSRRCVTVSLSAHEAARLDALVKSLDECVPPLWERSQRPTRSSVLRNVLLAKLAQRRRAAKR